jgi:hypothetical protein
VDEDIDDGWQRTKPKNRYPAPSSNLLFRKQFEPVSNNSLHQDFTPVLLGHAQLYLLADKYDVPELEKLVLHKLNHTLKESILYNEAHIASVVELVLHMTTRHLAINMKPLLSLIVKLMPRRREWVA